MRIAALAIYSLAGDRRVVRFRPGLNIVTGWSGTGKSSLLDIAEFCLGRTHPSYPVGVLTEAVAWFAAELEHDGVVITIARPAPGSTFAGVHNAMIQFGASVDDVSFAELAANTDARNIRAELTRLLGIPANQVRPGTLGRPPLAATASQALLFCFQGQGEIANKALLFHRADDEEIEDAIRTTLPYFVGAVDVDTIALRQELDDRRRDLRRAEARLERARLGRSREVDGASALLTEAAILGLTDPGREYRGQDALAELVRVRDLNLDVPEAAEATPTDAVLGPLRERQRELTGQLAALEHRLAVLTRASAERAAYGDELDEQRRRLAAIGLIPDDPGGDEQPPCPLCGQSLNHDHAQIDAIRRDLSELNAQLGDLRGSQPAAADRRGLLEDAIVQLRTEQRVVTSDIDAAVRSSSEVAQSGDLRSRRAFLQGRLTEFLVSLPVEEDAVSTLEHEVRRLERETAELNELLNPSSFQERTESLLRVISEDVTTWARTLGLGYSEHGIHIDPTDLTVVADTRQGPVDLDRMGSAANIMGYHVTAHLALHKWFIEQERPVPSFIMLDQPSQVFFPDDVRRPEDEEISDEDRERVTALYALIRDIVAGLDDRLQVIVLDHANLNLDWFQEAVVSNWRHGEALVPEEWLDATEDRP